MSTASVYNINIGNDLTFTSGATAGHILTVGSDGKTFWVPPSSITGGGGTGGGGINFPFPYILNNNNITIPGNLDLSSLGNNLVLVDIENVNANSLVLPDSNTLCSYFY